MTLAEYALAYARTGIAVFPLMVRQKKPYPYSDGFVSASHDPGQVGAWWSGQGRLTPKADAKVQKPIVVRATSNIGVATGAASGFWVLDLDGPEAEEGLAALVAVHGPLPVTPEQSTGRGRHLCFAYDPAFPIHNSAGKIGKNIDVRGDGGYIVAPPSIHPGDEKKGIPPGRVYAWTAGRSPLEIPFAPAPEWLSRMAMPVPEAPRPTGPVQPRVRIDGRASRYGERALDNACRDIALAPAGQRNNTLWLKSIGIGRLCAGGEIADQGYALQALRDAGRDMCARAGSAWTVKEEGTLTRGFELGLGDPRNAPVRDSFQPAERRPQAPLVSPAKVAEVIRDVRGLWAAARPADCKAFRMWLRVRGLDADAMPEALGRLRAYQRAPYGDGRDGPAVLVPLVRGELGEPEALAVLPLFEGAETIRGFVGDPAGAVAHLAGDAAQGALLVATDFQDAWALGSGAAESGDDVAVVLAPTPRAFSGEALGDKWGRIDPRTPHGDPAHGPWTLRAERPVYLAVRGDLRTGELKYRRTFGGTGRVVLHGEDAAQFHGGLARQAWVRAGANPVRILRPSAGVGFNSGRRGVGA